MQLPNQERGGTGGYAMAALLVAIAVLGVMLSVAMPTWRQLAQREKEEELIFRGQQYVRAIGLFQRRYAASFPPDIDTLVNQRFLRKKYKDPMTEDGEFQVLYQMSMLQQPGGPPGRGGTNTGRGGPQGSMQTQPGAGAAGGASSGGRGGTAFGFSGGGTLGPRGGVIGVASKSTATSLRLYNGRDHYNEWQFIFAPTFTPGQGMGRPGMPGMGGRGMGQPGFGGRSGTGPGGRRTGPGGSQRGPEGQPFPRQPGGRAPGN